MRKLLRTLSRMYWANEIKTFEGKLNGLERAYRILSRAYPDDPFVEGFVEGGLGSCYDYWRGIQRRSAESSMDSVKDLFWIGYYAGLSEIRRADSDLADKVEAVLKGLHLTLS